MKNVYILTREGREYSKEGLAHITNVLKDQCNEKDQLWFHMGTEYNDVDKYYDLLKEDKDSYTILSTSAGIEYLPPFQSEGTLGCIERYRDSGETGLTTWELLTREWEKFKNAIM